jgi:hypothetical protein
VPSKHVELFFDAKKTSPFTLHRDCLEAGDGGRFVTMDASIEQYQSLGEQAPAGTTKFGGLGRQMHLSSKEWSIKSPYPEARR